MRDSGVPKFAIIGGTGLTSLQNLQITRRENMQTPYGEPSAALSYGLLGKTEAVFLARHGDRHTIPPHRINYRANLWALKQTGVTHVIAVCAVGGISRWMAPRAIAIPDQIVDYTWSREQTFFDTESGHVRHIDFTFPYCEPLRTALIKAAATAGIQVIPHGTYGAKHGPRLETIAEIDRMERDGCDMVGMTGMPEASLARELDLCYAQCAVSANWAAGRSEGIIEMPEIEANLESAMQEVRELLVHLLMNASAFLDLAVPDQ
jgi:5'-methylthioinosine phosphorylase